MDIGINIQSSLGYEQEKNGYAHLTSDLGKQE